MKRTYLIIVIDTSIHRFDENVKNNVSIRFGEEPTNLSKVIMTILKIPLTDPRVNYRENCHQ